MGPSQRGQHTGRPAPGFSTKRRVWLLSEHARCAQVHMGIRYMHMVMTWMCVYIWEGAQKHAYVGICLTYLEIEGEQLRKDMRTPPPSIFTKRQLLHQLSVIAKALTITATSSAMKIHIIFLSYGCSMTLMHHQCDASLRHVSQKIGRLQNKFEN